MKKMPLDETEFIQLFRKAVVEEFKIPLPEGKKKDIHLKDYQQHLLQSIFGEGANEAYL